MDSLHNLLNPNQSSNASSSCDLKTNLKPIQFPKGPLRRNQSKRGHKRKRKRKEFDDDIADDFGIDQVEDHRDLLQSPPPINISTDSLFRTPSPRKLKKSKDRNPENGESKMLRNIFSFDQNGKINGNPFEFIDDQKDQKSNDQKADPIKSTEIIDTVEPSNNSKITANVGESENEHDSDCDVVIGLNVTPKGPERDSTKSLPMKRSNELNPVQNEQKQQNTLNEPEHESLHQMIWNQQQKRNRFNLSLCNGLSMAMELEMDRLESLMVNRVKLLEWCSSLKYEQRIDIIYNSSNRLFEQKLAEFGMDRIEYDDASHLMLRLAFCSDDRLRKWFIQSETALLRIKFCKSDCSEQRLFLKNVSQRNGDSNYLRFEEWNFEDLQQRGLLGKSPIPRLSASTATVKWIPFHAVPFQDICFLVKNRKVLVQNGMAIVPNYLFHIVVQEKFRKFLENKLDAIRGAQSEMAKDSAFQCQIGKIRDFVDGYVLKALSRPQINRTADNNVLSLRPIHKEIESKYLRYFPLCTRFIFDELSTKRHIKNSGRLQLSLYLKAIGMSRTEALRFWRKYEKKTNYEYFVNYHYLQKDYSSPSCSSNIKAHTNSGDCNGCPFKRFHGQNELMPILMRFYGDSLTKQQIQNEVLQNAGGKSQWGMMQRGGADTKYRNQCKRLFAALHLKGQHLVDIEDLKSSWRFPDQWFKMAYSLQNDRETFDRVFVHKPKRLTISY